MADGIWEAMSLERLRAAKALYQAGFWRDSISRSYYAAYCAATSIVIGRGITFAFGRQNPSHDQLPDLILNAAGMPVTRRRKIKRLLRVLREARENADYRPRSLADRQAALDGLHLAIAVLEILEVQENGIDTGRD